MKMLCRYTCLIVTIFLLNAKLSSQHFGAGVEGHYGIGSSSNGWSMQNAANYFGGDLFVETSGFLFNSKHLLGLTQVPYPFFSQESESEQRTQPAIRYQFQLKYWLSNGIRAGSIFDFKCAHAIKVVNYYRLKYYLIGGLDNALLMGKVNSGLEESRGYQLGGVIGLGAQFGLEDDLKKKTVFYLEARGVRQMTGLFKAEPTKNYKNLRLELAGGIKFF